MSALAPDLVAARARRVRLRFGEYELDPRRFELRRAGQLVPLAPQPYDLLWRLASRAGELVGRDEIRASLWGGGVFVEFDACVNFCVREVRKALGDDARAPRFIQAVRGRGYRFLPAVEVQADDAGGPDLP